ncbi:Putative ribonuclease H protein At1g65750 [Linum perenne]
MRKLESCLPADIVLQIGGMTPPRQEAGCDMLIWGLKLNGRFTIRSAYDLLKDHRLEDVDNSWQKIWSWKGPNKIRHFMWLTAQEKLMNNMERLRRHMSDRSECAACGGGGEDINHIFRGCNVARSIWSLILPEVVSVPQLELDFQSWWFANIGNPIINPLFGIVAWLIWKRRNKLVFDGVAWSTEDVRNQAKFWDLLLSSSWKAGHLGREAPSLARQAQSNKAAAGGLIRDHEGRLIASFASNLGSCSIMRVELRGIIDGMLLAWEKGVRKLMIQTDLRAAVEILLNDSDLAHRHASLVEQFSSLKNRDWEVSIHHVYREANFTADYLANVGHDLDLGTHVFLYPDTKLLYWLRYDLMGVSVPRLINNMS